MKELVERFIREHPGHRYDIIKKGNEYALSFFIGNDLHDLVICTSYDIVERKYQDLQNRACCVCYEDVNILCRCKYCGFKMCEDCIRKLEYFICPCYKCGTSYDAMVNEFKLVQ